MFKACTVSTPPAVIVDERDAPGAGVRVILNRIDLRASDTFIRQQCSSRGAAGEAHLLLDCDPQILHEMEPISDLARLRRTLASSLRVQPASVSADDLDRRVPLQPSRRTRHAPVAKDVDNRRQSEPFPFLIFPAPVPTSTTRAMAEETLARILKGWWRTARPSRSPLPLRLSCPTSRTRIASLFSSR